MRKFNPVSSNLLKTVSLRLVLVACLIFPSGLCFSQTKVEKEIRVKREDVPQQAQTFLDSLLVHTKIKWYQETNGADTSYEAKTTIEKRKHSIEFGIDGTFQDVEIQIDQKDLPIYTFDKMSTYLDSTYLRYKIDKIQIQYTGKRNLILNFFRTGVLDKNISTRFELVVTTRVDKTYQKFEYLFSEEGVFLKRIRIVLKNTDYLEY